MEISLPKDPIYYYECSNGDYRLTYFIPADHLRRLIAQGEVSPRVIDDYPDGVDLDCTEPDFEEFHQIYGYRPHTAPESILRAFFALLSSTRDWKKFRGSGYIPAVDIERIVGQIEAELETNRLTAAYIQPLPDHPTNKQRREWMKDQISKEAEINSFLEEKQVDGIKPRLTLSQQRYSPIEMSEGENVAAFYTRLLQARRRHRNDQ